MRLPTFYRHFLSRVQVKRLRRLPLIMVRQAGKVRSLWKEASPPYPPLLQRGGVLEIIRWKVGMIARHHLMKARMKLPLWRRGQGVRLFQAEEALTLCKQKLAEHQSLTTFKSEEYERQRLTLYQFYYLRTPHSLPDMRSSEKNSNLVCYCIIRLLSPTLLFLLLSFRIRSCFHILVLPPCA